MADYCLTCIVLYAIAIAIAIVIVIVIVIVFRKLSLDAGPSRIITTISRLKSNILTVLYLLLLFVRLLRNQTIRVRLLLLLA